MTRMLSVETVKSRISQTLGTDWDLSKMEYKGLQCKVNVTCPNGHSIWMRPINLMRGHGCLICADKSKRQLIYGVAYNDSDTRGKTESYKCWRRMIRRCYSPKFRAKHQSYLDCIVCEEWLMFSNFEKWFDKNYVKGYHLDKDILVKGNKIYSPDTCCFVPRIINNLFIKANKTRGDTPIGVSWHNNNFYASCRIYGTNRTHLGVYPTPEEAFNAYKEAKESYIKAVAQEYYDRGEITRRVYDALMKYEVEITD